MPDQLPEAALDQLRTQLAGQRSANAPMCKAIETMDAQLAVAPAALEAAEARFAAVSSCLCEMPFALVRRA